LETNLLKNTKIMYRIKKPIFKYSDYFVKYYDSIPLTYPYDMIESTKVRILFNLFLPIIINVPPA
jgi:hypothetical protein